MVVRLVLTTLRRMLVRILILLGMGVLIILLAITLR